jgi:hypothetical protein
MKVHLPPQEPHVLLPYSSPPIHGLEKGKTHRGFARAHEKSPSITKQKATVRDSWAGA